MSSSRLFLISTVLSACPPVRLSKRLSVRVHRSLPQTQPSSAPACLPSVSVPVASSRFLPNNTEFTHRRKERGEKKKERWKETKRGERKQYLLSSTRLLRGSLSLSLPRSLPMSLDPSRSLLLPLRAGVKLNGGLAHFLSGLSK